MLNVVSSCVKKDITAAYYAKNKAHPPYLDKYSVNQ